MNYFLRPAGAGGLLLSTNVSSANPSHNLGWSMCWIGTFFTVARRNSRLRAGARARRQFSVIAIGDGVNIALEGRKPEDAK